MGKLVNKKTLSESNFFLKKHMTKWHIVNIITKTLLIETVNGILDQLGEHLPYKQRVTGSSPVGPIYCEKR